MANHHRNHERNRKWRASIQIPEENPSTHISKLPPIYHIFEHPESIEQYEPKNDPTKYHFGIETIFHLKEFIHQRFHTNHRSECCSPILHWPFDINRIERHIKITDSHQYGIHTIEQKHFTRKTASAIKAICQLVAS